MDVIELVELLISTPSQIGQTAEIESIVASYLEKIPGAEIEMQLVPNHGNNVIARCIHDSTNPTIFINGHLDTVEICQGWTKEPFEPVIDGDKLYGLGGADMLSGIAIGMKTFEALAREVFVSFSLAFTDSDPSITSTILVIIIPIISVFCEIFGFEL